MIDDSKFINLESSISITGQRPAYLRLPDGSVIGIKRWKDVLRESCKYALLTNDSIPIPLPDRSGKKVTLLSTIKPAVGISYVTEHYNDQEIYLYVNYDANNCVANAIHILKFTKTSLNVTTAAVILKD